MTTSDLPSSSKFGKPLDHIAREFRLTSGVFLELLLVREVLVLESRYSRIEERTRLKGDALTMIGESVGRQAQMMPVQGSMQNHMKM